MKTDNVSLPQHDYLTETRLLHRLTWRDWVFALVIFATALYAQLFIAEHHMDVYEIAILWGSAVGVVALGWFFKHMQWFVPLSAALAWVSVQVYAGDFARAEQAFLLKYFLASQSAVMWLCFFTVMAFLCFSAGLLQAKMRPVSSHETLFSTATGFAWAASVFGFVGLLVRWHESYLLRPDAGHIPVSNLYEVFILFMVITALMYLYYAARYQAAKLGAFVYGFMCLLVGFVLWYSFERGAHQIQPLIPALQSWWMKIHVPANFVGYGAFCMAAALGVAELLALRHPEKSILPAAEVIDEIMYKAIAVGFLFFTIATVLGALWAADAWGRYWSWDPKETWALIVWLNYAIWLHLRLVAGWRGKVLAWWAIIGFFITAFAFLGVNMFLSGLHSYGTL